MGFEIEMYAYRIEPQVLSVPIFDDELIQVTAQVFHAYESRYIERFKRTYGFLPALCDNSDPNYRGLILRNKLLLFFRNTKTLVWVFSCRNRKVL